MNAIEAQVLSALDGLGATSADVANTLQNKGIRGFRDRIDACPISQYLNDQFPGHGFWTAGFGVSWDWHGAGGTNEVTAPAAVRGFVGEFDLGYYPQLDAWEESS